MLTRRRPTEEMFKDGHNLHNYVKTAYPNNLLKIMDPALSPQQVQMTTAASELINKEKSIISLFGIGLACSVEPPKERVNMMEVIRELNQIRNASRESRM